METCENCGAALNARQIREHARYCSRQCLNSAPAKRAAMSAWNKVRWEQWKASGNIPTLTPLARQRRSKARTLADKSRWKAWRKAKIVPPTHTTAANEKRSQTAKATWRKKRGVVS